MTPCFSGSTVSTRPLHQDAPLHRVAKGGKVPDGRMHYIRIDAGDLCTVKEQKQSLGIDHGDTSPPTYQIHRRNLLSCGSDNNNKKIDLSTIYYRESQLYWSG